MKKKRAHSGKLLIIALVVVGGAAAGFGYLNQTSVLKESTQETEAAVQTPVDPNSPIFAVKPNDIIIGKAEAPVTIIEYSSLSCPHCAHFHEATLPKLQKDYLDKGKAKLVMRYFPLNEPALRASMLVECADTSKRVTFIKVLFDMQKDWAYGDTFLEDLKRIAKVGGMDSATFDSCMADKTLETRILQSRQDAAMSAHVNSTPTFFINGVRLSAAGEIDDFKKALANPGAASKPAEAKINPAPPPPTAPAPAAPAPGAK